MRVKKRNGKEVAFDKNRIIVAISKAMKECNVEDIKFATNIADLIHSKEVSVITVEEIQDLIETKLMGSMYKDVAKAYVRYRYKRELVRDRYGELEHTLQKKIDCENVQNQNANIDEWSFGGRIGESSNIVQQQYALDNCMSKMSKNNHLNNEIYIHDLNSYAVGMHNCLSLNLDKLLQNGFNSRQTDIRPAQSINTAFQLLAVIFQLQSLQQFGGVSATHLDWSMSPYIKLSFLNHYKKGIKYIDNYAHISEKELEEFIKNRKDTKELWHIDDNCFKKHNIGVYNYAIECTTTELNQAVEGMYHNLNSLQSRSGNQLPFSSINYGTDTSVEGRMIIKSLLEGSLKGIGKLYRTSIFPCSIFQLKNGVNKKKGDPNYDLFKLALKSTSKRLYPNYVNCDWSGNAGADPNDITQMMSTMGCRTTNGADINGLGYRKDGRGNICPVTIILPTIAMEANREIEQFFKLLEIKLNEAKDMLLERYYHIISQSPKSAQFMYESGIIEGFEGTVESAMKHGTLAIGMIAISETLQLLIGKNQTTQEGMELAKRICQLYKDKCNEFKKEYSLNFGVYMTPAENLSYTSLKKFKEKYGTIQNVSDKEFFTNSIHVPVWEQFSPFEKIDIEAQLTKYSSAGCITYIELEANIRDNLEALEQYVIYAMDKDIPYFAVNVPSDVCMECGFDGELGDTCPKCGSSQIQRLRRVTGQPVR